MNLDFLTIKFTSNRFADYRSEASIVAIDILLIRFFKHSEFTSLVEVLRLVVVTPLLQSTNKLLPIKV